MRKCAFTLMELLIVLAIISILMGLGISSYQRQYARSQFRSGVVQIQVDLHRTRLLAMQSGEAYIFRFVPGSSIYEIAPLKTLQEAIYRSNGDDLDNDLDSLGGSLSSSSYSSSTAFSSNSLVNQSLYTDDLFSPENIAADMSAFRPDRSSSASGANTLSGSLSTSYNQGADDYSFGMGTTFNDFGSSNDFSGSGANISVDLNSTLGAANQQPTSIRELKPNEKQLTRENTIIWRVGANGALARKEVAGDVIFSSIRISASTPSNLRSKRSRGAKTSGGSTANSSSSNGKDLGSKLGGSLTSIPSGNEDGEGLGGGLSFSDSTEEQDLGNLSALEEESNISVWSEPIVFYPNGKTSTVVIGLASIGEYQYFSEVALRGMTGVARITSISATPPGSYYSSSVLTQEQLFRLSHPGQKDPSNNKKAKETILNGATSMAGGALGSAPPDAFNSPSDLMNGGMNDFQQSTIGTMNGDTNNSSPYNMGSMNGGVNNLGSSDFGTANGGMNNIVPSDMNSLNGDMNSLVPTNTDSMGGMTQLVPSNTGNEQTPGSSDNLNSPNDSSNDGVGTKNGGTL